MTLYEATRTCIVRKYCDFHGRASRSELWLFILACLLANIAAGIVGGILSGMGLLPAAAVLQGAVNLGLLPPLLCAQIRRLHDSGHSGWWAIPSLLPILTPLSIAGGPLTFLPVALIHTFLFLWVPCYLYLLVKAGTPQGSHNAFDDDPPYGRRPEEPRQNPHRGWRNAKDITPPQKALGQDESKDKPQEGATGRARLCPACGTASGARDRFCRHCGRDLSDPHGESGADGKER